MVRGDNPGELASLFEHLKRTAGSVYPEYDNETWRREALIRPLLIHGLGYREHEIVSEINFTVTGQERNLIAQRLRPGQTRVRPDFLIVPDFDKKVVAAIEAKKKTPDADILYHNYFDQLIIEQIVADCEFGILTDGEKLIVSCEGQPVMQFESLNELAKGFDTIRNWIGRDSQLLRGRRPAAAFQLLVMPIAEPESHPFVPDDERHRRIRRFFPLLRDFAIVSPASHEFNSVSWAAADTKRLWWPKSVYQYWPLAPLGDGVPEFMRAFSTLGYSECSNGAFEVETEKVALFSLDNQPTHASRQVSPGLWSSKLGQLETITHRLEDLAGGDYGQPVAFLKRRARIRRK